MSWYDRRVTRSSALAALLAAACGGSSELGRADGAAGADPDAAPAAPGAEYLFDDDALRTYELTVAPGDWQWLNDNALLEEYVPATLHFEGTEVGPIGVRYKGGYGTLTLCFDAGGTRRCPKLSIKLAFDEYDPDGRFFGVRKLNFHSMLRDPSLMHDRLGYGLHREMGVAAPRAVHARLIVNGELLGLFALVEQIDGRFTRDRFADGGEGNLYKEVWPVHATAQPYLDALETNEDEGPDVGPMIRFAEALAGAADAEFAAVLGAWMDVPMLMRYLAVDRAIDAWDGIVAWYCVGGTCFNHNYYWYQEVGRDRVWLIPWDLDNTFQVPNPIRSQFGMPDWDVVPASCEPIPVFLGIQGRAPACDPLMRRLATVTWDGYAEATRELLAGPFQVDALAAKLDRWEAQIAAAVAEDGAGPGSLAWQQALAELRAELPSLRAYVADKVGDP
jgi:hypothetical protein